MSFNIGHCKPFMEYSGKNKLGIFRAFSNGVIFRQKVFVVKTVLPPLHNWQQMTAYGEQMLRPKRKIYVCFKATQT